APGAPGYAHRYADERGVTPAPPRISGETAGLGGRSELARPLLKPPSEPTTRTRGPPRPLRGPGRRGRTTTMKLNGKMMVAVAMILGATTALGCNNAAEDTGAVAPVETPATAPVQNDTAAQT